MSASNIQMPTRRLDPAILETLKQLKTGDRITITQTVRVGAKQWLAKVTGVFRGINSLATGVTTDRYMPDDIIVPTVHFTKDNGELASITLDEKTLITRG